MFLNAYFYRLCESIFFGTVTYTFVSHEIINRVISVLQKSYFLINALSYVRFDCVGKFLASREVQTQQNEWVERATPTLQGR